MRSTKPIREWGRKPFTAIGYGGNGAARAVEQLRLIAIALRMVSTAASVHISGADFMSTSPMGPANRAASFTGFQLQILFGVADIDVRHSSTISKSAKIFKMPTMLTAFESKGSFSILWPQLLDIFPDQEPVDRNSMNFWEYEKLVDEGVFFASPEASYATGTLLNIDGGYRSRNSSTSDCGLNATKPVELSGEKP